MGMKTDGRAALIEAGTRMFAERGLSGVGIRELSRAAGTSISMVSYHFGGKEGLYEAVLAEQFACFDRIDEIRKEKGDPLSMIEGYLRWTLERHRSHPHLLRFYTSELTNPTPYFDRIVSPAIGKVIRTLAAIIGEGVRQGVFRKDVHAAGAATALAGMINYHVLITGASLALSGRAAMKDEALVRHYLAIFTRGILA
jgi:TetR/AcrR family transcriptional regulator